ncbi:MAG: FHA domain-containing protein [Mycobacteriales bacterium]
MFCTRCGQQNPSEARFCARCGAALVRPGDPVGAEGASDQTSTLTLGAFTGTEVPDSEEDSGPLDVIEALLPGTALLVVRRGPNAGSRFLLDAEVTSAGRHPESDIFLDDVTVSRRHAEFRRERGGFTVRDVGSLNGTYLNRERIDIAELTGGDEVQIGKFRLVFMVGPAIRPAQKGGQVNE